MPQRTPPRIDHASDHGRWTLLRRAVAGGAEIVIALKDEDHGGRAFFCRDPEGHLWNVGTYDPWAAGP